MPIAHTLLSIRRRLLALCERLGFLPLLLIRITVGAVFLRTGWGKLNTLPDVTDFFTSLGIPFPAANAVIAASVEFFGGIAILIGLGARLVALPLIFVMIVAIATAQWSDVDGIHAFLALDEWAYIVMFLVIAIKGPGSVSIDALIARRLDRAAGR